MSACQQHDGAAPTACGAPATSRVPDYWMGALARRRFGRDLLLCEAHRERWAAMHIFGPKAEPLNPVSATNDNSTSPGHSEQRR